MKILSKPWVKATLVVIGLLAVLFTYRPGNQKKSANEEVVFAEGKTIKLRSPQQLPEPVAVQSPSQGDYPATEFDGFGNDFESQPSMEVAMPLASVEPAFDENNLDLGSLTMDEPSIEPTFDQSFIETESSEPQTKPVDYVEPARAEPATAETTSFVATQLSNPSTTVSDVAALRAVHHIEYGKSLARRNATEAAGQEFLSALRVLAEANDEATGGNAYLGALRKGMLAIKEAADFKTEDPGSQISMNIANLIEGHETKAIGANEARTMGASAALRRYFEFAGEQLGRCGGQNPVAAEALYCLGKMNTITSQWNPDPESTSLYEAIIFHHAAMTADPTNFRSSNELGVLLARTGHLEAAENYLKNSLKINPTAQGWANLAKVHQRKGSQQDQQLANLAMHEYQIALNLPLPSMVSGPIVLVEPQEFIARSPIQHPSETETVQVPNEVVPVANVQPEAGPTFVQRIGSLFTKQDSQR